MKRLEILQGMLERNGGHSMHAHKGTFLIEPRLVKGCFRCELIRKIEAEKQRLKLRPAYQAAMISAPV